MKCTICGLTNDLHYDSDHKFTFGRINKKLQKRIRKETRYDDVIFSGQPHDEDY
jgi:hypothetical protein